MYIKWRGGSTTHPAPTSAVWLDLQAPMWHSQVKATDRCTQAKRIQCSLVGTLYHKSTIEQGFVLFGGPFTKLHQLLGTGTTFTPSKFLQKCLQCLYLNRFVCYGIPADCFMQNSLAPNPKYLIKNDYYLDPLGPRTLLILPLATRLKSGYMKYHPD